MALDHLEAHPLAAGDCYPGDLLKNVMEAPESFWNNHAELRERLVNALERALERVRKVNTVPELEGRTQSGSEASRGILTVECDKLASEALGPRT
jgi:hypothetical protein